MVAAMILAIAIALMFFGSRSTYYILKVLAGVAWEGLFTWWIYAPFTVAGSPAHIIVLMVVQITGISCFFWGFWADKYGSNGQKTGGGRLRLPFMPDDADEKELNERSAPTRQERLSIYQAKLDAASRGERRSR